MLCPSTFNFIARLHLLKRTHKTNYARLSGQAYVCQSDCEAPRVHNKRREREYPTSIILPNALRKVMTLQPVITFGVKCFE